MRTIISAESLGSEEFRSDYNLKYAYSAGGMYKGIASKEMVIRMGKAGFLSFFGAGGLGFSEIENTIKYIQNELKNEEPYGMNLVYNINRPDFEEKTIDLYLKYNVNNIETAAYMAISKSLVKYRLKGVKRDEDGDIIIPNRILAKISRPEVVEKFLSPAPENIVNGLLEENKITEEEAELSKYFPIAYDICAEADSGGHTDRAASFTLIPTIIRIRDLMMEKYHYAKKIRVGAAGGIGTPESAAAAYVLGADFITTGSINQCTIEANISDSAKDLLQEMNIQDTEHAPAGDMFELGAKVQVLKKGVFFPARANKLYDLYCNFKSIDDLDENIKKQIQKKYFKRTFGDIFNECRSFYSPLEIEKAEKYPRKKMAMIFKWYFGYSTQLALEGREDGKVDYQINCGPALGAFNQWVKGTGLESWRNRHVDDIGIMIMKGTADYLNKRYNMLMN
jgi:trans-AT polyketide synthase/acyltransferase/oxidoreductase domain-containing protein